MPRINRWWILKPVVFLACLVPIVWLLFDTFTGHLSANPLEDIRDRTGIWTLRFLVITLSVTPLRRISGWSSLIRFRRMLGLFGFFYGFVHLATYVWLDQYFDFNAIFKDMFLTRPFIITGFISFLLLLPLAITSTRKWIVRLGGSVRGGRAAIRTQVDSAGRPIRRAPVIDIIEVRLRTRSGKCAATVWAIMPPIDAPTRWAAPMPRASSRPTVSAARSPSS